MEDLQSLRDKLTSLKNLPQIGLGEKILINQLETAIRIEEAKIKQQKIENNLSVKISNPLPVSVSGVVATGGLTDTQLRATPVPVSGTVSTGGLTDTQIRATPLPVSGTVTTGGLTDTQIRATPLPVSGTVSTGLSQPLTDTQLRLTPVPISGSVSVTGGAVDSTVLYTGTLNAIGATTGFDTTGYASISIQISGTWVGNLNIEACNDNVGYLPIYVLNTNEIAMQDVVYGNGNFVFKVASKFARVEVNQLQSGSITVLILGRTSLGGSSSDMLSLAMDKSNNTPLYVEETATKKDLSNALIPSDAPKPFYGSSITSGAILNQIDTTGYQSVSVQFVGSFGTATVAFTSSNDNANFAPVVGYSSSITSTQAGSSFSASSGNIFVFPCTGKFFRVTLSSTPTGVCQTICQLRQFPCMVGPLNTNVAMISGNAAVTGGVSGTLAVGGNIAVGVAPTLNPVNIAGVDGTGLLRRFLTDTSGRLILSVTDQAGTARAINGLAPSTNPYNVTALPIIDVSSFEGQSTTELLAMILLEMKINNQYLYELPLTLQRVLNDTTKNVGGFGNEPQEFRNDSTVFLS